MTAFNWEKAAQRDRINKNGFSDFRADNIPRTIYKPLKGQDALKAELKSLLRNRRPNFNQRKRIDILKNCLGKK